MMLFSNQYQQNMVMPSNEEVFIICFVHLCAGIVISDETRKNPDEIVGLNTFETIVETLRR